MDLPKVFRFNSYLMALLDSNPTIREGAGMLLSLLTAVNTVIEMSDVIVPEN
jgi:hypothetical protein